MTHMDAQSRPPAAPPRPPVQDASLPPRNPVRTVPGWARVIGVLSIVGGVLGAWFGLVNMARAHDVLAWHSSPWDLHWMGGSLAIVAGILQIAASVVLVIAGVWLVRRRRVGISLHYAGATGRLVAFVAHVVLTAGLAHLGKAGPYWVTSTVVGALFGAVYPAFVLVWLTQRSVRKATAGWS